MYGKRLTRFIGKRTRFFSYKNNKFKIDGDGFRVANHRITQGKNLEDRGRILDRNGLVLAESIQGMVGNITRKYPLGLATAPLLGVAHPIYGLKGLEKTLNSWLAGRQHSSAFSSFYRLASGRQKTTDIKLTIDGAVQQKIYQSMAHKTGAVVVLDINSGEMLAAVSTPAFDPSQPAGKYWEDEVKKGYRSGFVNRTLERRYPPGSTFKLVTAAAWADRTDFDIKWGMRCRGRHKTLGISDHNKRGHGWVSLQTAVSVSCNVFFSDIGVRLGPLLLKEANRFGFNRSWLPAGKKSTSLQSLAFAGYPAVNSGREWTALNFNNNPKLVAQGAIGQNVVLATPLQMALTIAAIGNDGVMMKPRLVRGAYFSDHDASVGLINQWPDTKGEVGRSCRKDTAKMLVEMMKKVMQTGTGYSIPKLYKYRGKYILSSILPKGETTQLLGKTGTAETGRGRADHSWFVGLAPADKPRYAVAVIVEHGGLGAKVAGPIAARAMRDVLNMK
ncbi:related to penicillin-binding protein (PbpA) [Desulfotalea psychrophila LSv54]|uniref:Related to penicillin-binding protein (PbpA) n=2 Tax=Desulfotalea psychrophila TaxID=84980 RepID=Q6AKH3_DESPS|nr:related to penicillin-binding protein (PbpA) [Desulfotalea psychrophila LSv54]